MTNFQVRRLPRIPDPVFLAHPPVGSFASKGVTGATAILVTYTAGPSGLHQTGVRLSCANEDGVIHADPNAGSPTTLPSVSATCAGFTVLN
jgi:hypothetical protein